MQGNAARAGSAASAARWKRLGWGAAAWLYVNAALLLWAYGWSAWLIGLISSTAVIVAGAWATGWLYPAFCVASGVVFWAAALLGNGDQHPGQALIAWVAAASVLLLAAAAARLLLRWLEGTSVQSPPAAPPPPGPSYEPEPYDPSGLPDPGLEPAPEPAVPVAPAPALRAGAEADPDEEADALCTASLPGTRAPL